MDPELQIMFHVLLLAICFVVGAINCYHMDYGSVNDEARQKPLLLYLGPSRLVIWFSLLFFIPFEILFWVLRWIFVWSKIEGLEHDPNNVSVNYNWESDEIVITIWRGFQSRPNSYEEAETDCKEDFNQVDAFVFIKEGKDTLNDFSFVGNQFTHNGWENSKIKDAKAKISRRFVVMIDLGPYTCKRELMNTSISVVKNY